MDRAAAGMMRSDAFAWLEEGREGNRRDSNMGRVTSRGLDRIMPVGGRIYRIRRDYATRCSLIGSNGQRCEWLDIVMVSSNESIVVFGHNTRCALSSN